MVFQAHSDVDQLSSFSSQEESTAAATTQPRPATSTEQNVTRSIPGVRRSLQRQGISTQASNLIMCSWRTSTKNQYSPYITGWLDFSSEQGCDAHAPPLEKVLDYLTSLCAKGLGYSVINTARSALSAMAITDSDQPVGKHLLVIRLFKGVFQSRPALPRCSVTWDTDTALKHLRKLSPVRELLLKQLTLKLVVLIPLLSGQRIQSIHLLDTRNMSKSKSGYNSG